MLTVLFRKKVLLKYPTSEAFVNTREGTGPLFYLRGQSDFFLELRGKNGKIG
jgi:hypothetical protein